MRTAAALLAVMAMPLSVVAGVQRAEAPQAASLAATMAGAYGVGAVVLWLAAEAIRWRGRRGGGWR
jgi:hypothetical protein